MIHFNGNKVAVIDVETTGFIAGHHDIWQICVLLLDDDLTPHRKVMPFYMNLKLKRPDNVDKDALRISRLNFAEIQLKASCPFDAAELFEGWFQKLIKDKIIPERKSLLPLAQNWVFDRPFIIDWLGQLTFDYIFHPWYRDTLAVAQYLNDRHGADLTEPFLYKVPFPKSNLGYICSQLKVTNAKAHDALQDCIATAECYRRMVLGQLPT